MHDRSNLLINIVVAVLGAFLAGYFLSPLLHVGTINDAITIPTMLVTLLGSIILEALIALRIGLKLIGANPSSPLAVFVYGFTSLFLFPFKGLIGTPTVGR